MTQWRLLEYSRHSGAENMAVDEAILENLVLNGGQPTLRFYGWEPPAVSIGYFQKARLEVDTEKCRELGIDLVRRPTGGRAVLHDQEITYSICISEKILSGSVVETCNKISKALLRGLGNLGIRADLHRGRPGKALTASCFDAPSLYEVGVGGRKIIGSAQVRRNGVILQQGSIILEFDALKTVSVLSFANEEHRRRALKVLKERAGGLYDFLPVPKSEAEILDAFADGFRVEFGVDLVAGALSTHEIDVSERLRQQKYENNLWNYRR